MQPGANTPGCFGQAPNVGCTVCCVLLSLIDWISQTLSQRYTNLQSLAKCVLLCFTRMCVVSSRGMHMFPSPLNVHRVFFKTLTMDDLCQSLQDKCAKSIIALVYECEAC